MVCSVLPGLRGHLKKRLHVALGRRDVRILPDRNAGTHLLKELLPAAQLRQWSALQSKLNTGLHA